jgi:hypothetical protein
MIEGCTPRVKTGSISAISSAERKGGCSSLYWNLVANTAAAAAAAAV